MKVTCKVCKQTFGRLVLGDICQSCYLKQTSEKELKRAVYDALREK